MTYCPEITETSIIHYSKYGYIALESGDRGSEDVIILLGGLTDGPFTMPYTRRLECSGWSLVSPVLRSSYLMYGLYRLTHDVSDINMLIESLQTNRSIKRIVFIGSSSGCQIGVAYCQSGKYANLVKGLILQAPVSDREALTLTETPEFIQSRIRESRMLVQANKSKRIVYQSYHYSPISAQRFLDLYSYNGMDDMFSSDFTDVRLVSKLNNIAIQKDERVKRHVLVVTSLKDEFVPEGVYPEHGKRIVAAISQGHSESICHDGEECLHNSHVHIGSLEIDSGHLLDDVASQDIFIARVQEFVSMVQSHP